MSPTIALGAVARTVPPRAAHCVAVAPTISMGGLSRTVPQVDPTAQAIAPAVTITGAASRPAAQAHASCVALAPSTGPGTYITTWLPNPWRTTWVLAGTRKA